MCMQPDSKSICLAEEHIVVIAKTILQSTDIFQQEPANTDLENRH